ncbi:MAG: diadenylate cyclase CdaA [Bacteroidaceae bacterium]|nr:diadenylate cyclase CdaA [Bacteroidaceae bacterium]
MPDYFVSFGVKDIIDVVCVALLLFSLYKLMKKTGSLNMFIGILVFILVWMVVSVLKMQLLGAILNKLVDVGVIAIIVLFADDIRRFFRDLGTGTRTKNLFHWLTRRRVEEGADLAKWMPVVQACENMSREKVGALIVFGQNDELHDISLTGEQINANVSQRLIENIFFKNTPLHDGAMLIIGDRIESAACILPVSDSQSLPKSFGLRHRAAMGVVEKTNAVAVVVSEETGHVTVFCGGNFQKDMKPDSLAKFLAENVR